MWQENVCARWGVTWTHSTSQRFPVSNTYLSKPKNIEKTHPTKTMHVPRNPQYNMHICDMGGGRVGWGGAITIMSSGTCMECILCSQGGDWWGGVGQ